MTKPRLDSGRAAGSQEPGEASGSPFVGASGCSWVVDFNDGNANDYDHNNDARVRAVRSAPAGAGEYQGAVSLRELHDAWKCARAHKSPSRNQLRFDARWLDGLLDLQHRLNTGTWAPAPMACFIATRPKAREIHAPDFADRVVHHWLVPILERIYEPAFSSASYANRAGKGTHAAVRALQGYVRQVESGQGGGYYLQLDVRNFFNSIDRRRLWTQIKRRMQRHGVPMVAQRAVHALLSRPPLERGVHYLCSAEERAQVPMHKRLSSAPAHCGLPIGNLPSQFLANVWLDRLDQFIKRRLGARRYVRYVDDFVLVHQDRAQLVAWKRDIENFLRDELGLGLKDEGRLAPLADGIDFLGYVIRPRYTLVRRRVVQHARQALATWARRHVGADAVSATPAQYRDVIATWASYCGHFAQANTLRLIADFHRRLPWLQVVTGVKRRFALELEDTAVTLPLGACA